MNNNRRVSVPELRAFDFCWKYETDCESPLSRLQICQQRQSTKTVKSRPRLRMHRLSFRTTTTRSLSLPPIDVTTDSDWRGKVRLLVIWTLTSGCNRLPVANKVSALCFDIQIHFHPWMLRIERNQSSKGFCIKNSFAKQIIWFISAIWSEWRKVCNKITISETSASHSGRGAINYLRDSDLDFCWQQSFACFSLSRKPNSQQKNSRRQKPI